MSPRPVRRPKNKQKTLQLVSEPQRGRSMLPSLTVLPSLILKKNDSKNSWLKSVPPLDDSCSGTQVNQPVSKFKLIILYELRGWLSRVCPLFLMISLFLIKQLRLS